MKQETKDDLQRIAESHDIPMERVREIYDEKLETFMAGAQSDNDASTVEQFAVSATNNQISNFGDQPEGDVADAAVLTLGRRIKEGAYWITGDGNDGIHGLGIVKPPEKPVGVGIFKLEEDHGVDLTHAADVFEPLNTVRARVACRQVGSRDGENVVKRGGNPVYRCDSVGDTTLEVLDPESVSDTDPLSKLPSDREPKRQLVNNNFFDGHQVKIANVTQNLAAVNDRGYAMALGADVKRFTGQIIDQYSPVNQGWGSMTLLDQDTFEEDEVPDELVTDQMRKPGLNVRFPPDMMTYEDGSIVDVYGFIEQYQGQYRMEGFGMIPVSVVAERDPTEDNADDEPEDDHEQDTI